MAPRPVDCASWWLLCLALFAPLGVLLARIFAERLGPEPAEYVVHYLGECALYILFFTLLLSPLSSLSRKLNWVRYRRMVGLWCLAYAIMHALAYPVFLADWSNILEDLTQRPYIIVGALALLILILLGVTSPKYMMKRLGRRWKPLHRAIYLALLLVLLHLWWQVRSDYTEALSYTGIAILLMYFRGAWFKRQLSKSRPVS